MESSIAPNGRPAFNSVRVQLQSEPLSCCLGKWSHSRAVIAADGRFRVDNVRSGDYRISITDLPEGFYLKDARLSGRDVFMRLCVPRRNSLWPSRCGSRNR